MEAASIDEAKAFLYGQPVGSFVAERDALAKAIRATGDRTLANEVKALRKPSAVAAVVNEVVRADPNGVELILQAAELLRSAQAGALDGTTVNTAELQARYRAAIRALAQSAASRRVEVRAALEAATIDEASNEDLRTGCLVAVPTPISIFGAAAPAPAGPAPAAPKSTDQLAARRTRRRSNAAAKKVEKAAAKDAAAEKAAAEKAEKERQKALRKQLRDVQKRHRAALGVHATALADEEAAALAMSGSQQDLVAIEDEIASAEQALAELRVRRQELAAERDRCEQARTAANRRAREAQAAVDALAETLASLADAQP